MLFLDFIFVITLIVIILNTGFLLIQGYLKDAGIFLIKGVVIAAFQVAVIGFLILGIPIEVLFKHYFLEGTKILQELVKKNLGTSFDFKLWKSDDFEFRATTVYPSKGEKVTLEGKSSPNSQVVINDPVSMVCVRVKCDENGRFTYTTRPINEFGYYTFTATNNNETVGINICVVVPKNDLRPLTQGERRRLREQYSSFVDAYWDFDNKFTTNISNVSFSISQPKSIGTKHDDDYLACFFAIKQNHIYPSNNRYSLQAFKQGEQVFQERTNSINADPNHVLVYIFAGASCVLGAKVTLGASCIPLAIIITGDIVKMQIKESVEKGYMPREQAELILRIHRITGIITGTLGAIGAISAASPVDQIRASLTALDNLNKEYTFSKFKEDKNSYQIKYEQNTTQSELIIKINKQNKSE